MTESTALRCTAFEELMLSQDTTAFPCNIYVRMRMSGKVDHENFSTAYRMMLDHHPLMRATLRSRFGRSRWCVQADAQHAIQWGTYRPSETSPEDKLNLPVEGKFDLNREPGIQVAVWEPIGDSSTACEPPITLIAFKIHHAIADGLAINAAIHDLWLAYDALVHNRPVTMSIVEPSRLKERNRFVSSVGGLLRLIPKQLVGLLGVRQYLMRKPVPLVGSSENTPGTKESLAFAAVSHECCEAVTEALRQESRRRKISLNDYLAACVFRAAAEFCSERNDVLNGQWLRMMVPVSLRTSSDQQRLPACNVVSSVFLDRTGDQIRDFDQLAGSVHEEMELIKNNRLALMFIFSLWIKKQLTFNKRQTIIKSCQTSLVFSNLGKLFFKSPLRDKEQRVSPGNLKLETYEIYAPLTPFMYAAFSTLIYRDRLMLCLRFDPRQITLADAKQLLRGVVAEFAHHKPVEAMAK